MIPIGTTFIRRGNKRKDVETVVDVYTTTNTKGDVVKTTYVASHVFMGQTIINHDTAATTIMRGLMNTTAKATE